MPSRPRSGPPATPRSACGPAGAAASPGHSGRAAKRGRGARRGPRSDTRRRGRRRGLRPFDGPRPRRGRSLDRRRSGSSRRSPDRLHMVCELDTSRPLGEKAVAASRQSRRDWGAPCSIAATRVHCGGGTRSSRRWWPHPAWRTRPGPLQRLLSRRR